MRTHSKSNHLSGCIFSYVTWTWPASSFETPFETLCCHLALSEAISSHDLIIGLLEQLFCLFWIWIWIWISIENDCKLMYGWQVYIVKVCQLVGTNIYCLFPRSCCMRPELAVRLNHHIKMKTIKSNFRQFPSTFFSLVNFLMLFVHHSSVRSSWENWSQMLQMPWIR